MKNTTTLFLLCFLTVPQLLPAITNKYVIYKCDDLTYNYSTHSVSERWQLFADYLDSQNIKANIGIICTNIERGNSTFSNWIKSHAVQNGGNFEFWNHGLDHGTFYGDGYTNYEFRGWDYEYQSYHFLRAQSNVQGLGITMTAFGAGNNAIDSVTASVLNACPDIKVCLNTITNVGLNCMVLYQRGWFETGMGVLYSFDSFTNWWNNQFKNYEYIVLQCHPGSAPDGATNFISNFARIYEFMKGNGCKFVHATEYYNIVMGGSNAPAVNGALSSRTTNAAFTINLSVDKNWGYWSTNGVNYNQFSVSGTNITISKTTTLSWYGASNGISSSTNSALYTFDTNAPTVSGIPASFSTNAAFSFTAAVNENYGYLSTNGINFGVFSQSGSNVTIASSTTLWYFGRDILGNTSRTNTVAYTLTLPETAPVVSGAIASILTNRAFSIVLTVDKGMGYCSINNGSFAAFTPGGTNLSFSSNAVLRTYAVKSNVYSITNTYAYTFDYDAPVISGIPKSFKTNQPFNLSIKVNERFGYISTDNKVFSAFSPDTNITISNTTTLWYSSKDLLGNTSDVNSVTFTVEEQKFYTRLDEVKVIGSPYRGIGDGIILNGLPRGTSVSIFSVSGRLINTFILQESSESGSLQWNLKDQKGRRVAPGIYITHLKCLVKGEGLEEESRIIRLMILPY